MKAVVLTMLASLVACHDEKAKGRDDGFEPVLRAHLDALRDGRVDQACAVVKLGYDACTLHQPPDAGASWCDARQICERDYVARLRAVAPYLPGAKVSSYREEIVGQDLGYVRVIAHVHLEGARGGGNLAFEAVRYGDPWQILRAPTAE